MAVPSEDFTVTDVSNSVSPSLFSVTVMKLPPSLPEYLIPENDTSTPKERRKRKRRSS